MTVRLTAHEFGIIVYVCWNPQSQDLHMMSRASLQDSKVVDLEHWEEVQRFALQRHVVSKLGGSGSVQNTPTGSGYKLHNISGLESSAGVYRTK